MPTAIVGSADTRLIPTSWSPTIRAIFPREARFGVPWRDALVPQPLAALTFDHLRLIDLLDNDEKLMSQVLAMSLERMPIAIANLEAAFKDGKNDEAERYAHSIKGSAANVGALALSAIALQLECLATEGDRAAFGALLETLKDEFASFRAAVLDAGCEPGDCPDAKGT